MDADKTPPTSPAAAKAPPAAAKQEPAPKPQRVRATARGFLGGAIREIGDVFTIDSDRAFSARWMEPAPKAGA